MLAPRPFALGTFDAGSGPFAGMVLGDRVVALDEHLGSETSLRHLLEDWDVSLARLQELANGVVDGDGQLTGELRPLAPIQPPGQIFQAGANYRQHVLDLIDGAERRGDSSDGLTTAARDQMREELDPRQAKRQPFVFMGSTHAMVGACDDVILPAESEQSDWELELAAVIGRRARRVPVEQALEAVAGYMICNDLTSRDALHRPDSPGLGLDWLAGKNSPTFLPTGPWFVPAVHAGDPKNLTITLTVNERVMQDASTADMIFDVPALIAYISTIAELRPGDLVLTGSPAGNGASHGVFLTPGDVMHGTITGLGAQLSHCVADPSGALPDGRTPRRATANGQSA
jgi:2,4-diketo-3-deoxy-L-fuconate hydrolase